MDGFCYDVLYASLLDVGFHIWKVGVATCLSHSMGIVCNHGWVCEGHMCVYIYIYRHTHTFICVLCIFELEDLGDLGILTCLGLFKNNYIVHEWFGSLIVMDYDITTFLGRYFFSKMKILDGQRQIEFPCGQDPYLVPTSLVGIFGSPWNLQFDWGPWQNDHALNLLSSS